MDALRTQMLAVAFCDEPCGMRKAYTECEVNRAMLDLTHSEIVEHLFANVLTGRQS